MQRGEIKKTAVDSSALRVGHKAMAAVVVEIKDGFHAQSHAPLDENYIKFVVKLDETPGLTFGPPQYPPGEVIDYPALGKLSVYTGKVIVRIPIEVKADAKPGPVEISGKVKYQVCDDKVCYPPESPAFKIKTEIVAADAAVKPNEPELFKKEERSSRDVREAATQSVAQAGNSAAPPAPPTEIAGKQTPIAVEFLTAFLVGIIFNIVPCVLPVLPLKAMGFYEASQHSRLRSLSFGTAFSLGLIATFAAFGIFIFGYRWIGRSHPLDWGQLFTNPWFTFLMLAILVGMAAQTFGAFNVGVPNWLYGVSARKDTYWGNFLFGILTGVLSTPCTFGMFVVLLGWAALQTPSIAVLILITVGAGMAFPYFVLSALPEVARRFPHTGPWAELVKQMMGFLMLVAAVYFARPFLGHLVSGETSWWLVYAMLVIAALYLLIRTFQFARSAVAPVVGIVLALAMVLGTLPSVLRLTAKPYTWQPYTTAIVLGARGNNQIVLIDFTADWCSTCQYVEAKVLKSRPIIETVDRHHVVMIKADVTRGDAPARPLLDDLNPAGSIPLTVIYSPNLPQPIKLIGIYTQDDLERAIAAADHPGPTSVARGA